MLPRAEAGGLIFGYRSSQNKSSDTAPTSNPNPNSTPLLYLRPNWLGKMTCRPARCLTLTKTVKLTLTLVLTLTLTLALALNLALTLNQGQDEGQVY